MKKPGQPQQLTAEQQRQRQKEIKEKQKEEEARIKKLQEEKKQERVQHLKELDEKFGKLVKYLRKHEFKEKEALWADKRIQFFRSDDFLEYIKQNIKQIKPLIPEFGWDKYTELSDEQLWQLVQYLLDEGIIMRFERVEEPGVKKLKYPKRIIYNNSLVAPGPSVGNFDKCFYHFDVQEETKKLALYSFLFISLIALICLFPVWPFIVKKGIFYVSLYMLIFLTGFIIVRLVLFLFLRSMGWSFWVLPNIFNDDVSFVEQFKPFISCERENDSWLVFGLRVILFVWLIFASLYVWQEREVIAEQSKAGIDDIYEWGINKMQNADLPARALPGYEQFQEPEQEDEVLIDQDIEQNQQQQAEQQQEEQNQQQEQTQDL